MGKQKIEIAWTKSQHDDFVIHHDNVHAELQNTMNRTIQKLDKIQSTVDTVSANGRPGLQNSLQDLYIALRSVEKSIVDLGVLTEGLRIENNFVKSFASWKEAKKYRTWIFSTKGITAFGVSLLIFHKFVLEHTVAGKTILQWIWDVIW